MAITSIFQASVLHIVDVFSANRILQKRIQIKLSLTVYWTIAQYRVWVQWQWPNNYCGLNTRQFCWLSYFTRQWNTARRFADLITCLNKTFENKTNLELHFQGIVIFANALFHIMFYCWIKLYKFLLIK